MCVCVGGGGVQHYIVMWQPRFGRLLYQRRIIELTIIKDTHQVSQSWFSKSHLRDVAFAVKTISVLPYCTLSVRFQTDYVDEH